MQMTMTMHRLDCIRCGAAADESEQQLTRLVPVSHSTEYHRVALDLGMQNRMIKYHARHPYHPLHLLMVQSTLDKFVPEPSLCRLLQATLYNKQR